MLKRICILAAIAAMVFLAAAPVQAQIAKPPANAKSSAVRPKNLKPAVRSKETTRAINVGDGTATAATGAMSNAQLKAMLEGLGYEIEVLGEGDAAAYSVTEDGWKVIVSLAPDGANVWVSAYLQKLADPAKAPVDKVLGILSWNGAAAHFVYFGETQQLWIERDLANTSVKPAALRKTISGVCGVMTGSFDLWKEGALSP